MQRQAKNLKAALVKTVNTEGLKSKITEKFMGFLRVNANKLYQSTNDSNKLNNSQLDTSLSFMDSDTKVDAAEMAAGGARRQTVAITLKNLQDKMDKEV